MAAKLRAVGSEEKAVPKRTMSVVEAAESGSRLDELVAMRAVIARALDDPNTSARDLAALSRRQIEISKEIEAMRVRAREEAESAVESPDEAWDASAI